jgi:hypothetical protein
MPMQRAVQTTLLLIELNNAPMYWCGHEIGEKPHPFTIVAIVVLPE